jgi:hypothetical protein
MEKERRNELDALAKESIKYKDYNWKRLYDLAATLSVPEANYLVRYGESLYKYFFKPQEQYEKEGKGLTEYQKQTLKELAYQEKAVLAKEAEILESIFENRDEKVFLLTRLLDRITFNTYYKHKVESLKAIEQNVLPNIDLLQGVLFKALTKKGVVNISYMQEKLKNKNYAQCKFILEKEILGSDYSVAM